MSNQLETGLLRIEECPDLLVDCCVCDEQQNLVFLSAWGRDTTLQEFLARLTLKTADGGLDQFHLMMGRDTPVFVNVDMFEKRTTRQYKGTPFGNLIHLWLFDRRCLQPDHANHFAYALVQKDESPQDKLWHLVKDACPLPLLDHWQDKVMAVLLEHDMLCPLPSLYGPLTAWRMTLKLDVLERGIGQLIQQHTLANQAPT